MIQTNTFKFDTLRYANRLKKVGVPNEQAEELAELQAEIINSNLATKTDIALVHKDIELIRKDIEQLRKDIEQLRKDTKTDIARVEASLKMEIASTKEVLETKIESIDKRTTLILWVVTILGIINALPIVIPLIKNSM